MSKITWISLILFVILWIVFAKFWLKNSTDEFKFYDRDKFMVFPTPKIVTKDLDDKTNPQTATGSSSPTLEYISSTDSSVIKF
jgi:hypothetical protein